MKTQDRITLALCALIILTLTSIRALQLNHLVYEGQLRSINAEVTYGRNN